ncbi:sensor histidine kinase [Aquimarina sp. 433]
MAQLSTKTIQTIQRIFYVALVSFIMYHLVKTAYYFLPDSILFFFTSDAIENLICVLIAFVLYHYVLRLERLWKKTAYVVFFIVILLALASLKEYRIYSIHRLEKIYDYFTSFLGRSLLFYLLFYFVHQLETLTKYKTLEKELHFAKKQLLRNQLHPHFLFNAFNSLYSLSLKNSTETSEYILKLSSMMRYMTDESHPEKVSLSKEIGFIHQYIAIEKIRFGKDANIQFTFTNNTSQPLFIEPFLLITLVENAFKHGFYTNTKNAYVHIALVLDNNELLFSVENSVFKKQHFQETQRKGKGLENLKNRLKLLYPKNAWLTISKTETVFKAELKIILHDI